MTPPLPSRGTNTTRPAPQELLDETGIIPLLNDAGGGNDASSLAAAFNLLGDALAGTGVGSSAAGGSSSSFPPDTDSWERGVAISNDPREDDHSVEKGLIRSSNGDLEELDEVDVIMQVRGRGGEKRGGRGGGGCTQFVHVR